MTKPCPLWMWGDWGIQNKCTRLLGLTQETSVNLSLRWQETHFHLRCRTVGWWKNNFKRFSQHMGSHTSTGVSLLVGCSLNADCWTLFFAGDRGQLVCGRCLPLKSFSVPSGCGFMRPTSLRIGFPFFIHWHRSWDDTKRLVLMGDWNAILDPKIDMVGWGASS